jgi:hypothetical protein
MRAVVLCMEPKYHILHFLELETLRFSCTPILWTDEDGVLIMQPMDAREMTVAG